MNMEQVEVHEITADENFEKLAEEQLAGLVGRPQKEDILYRKISDSEWEAYEVVGFEHPREEGLSATVWVIYRGDWQQYQRKFLKENATKANR
jgi:hypothetical protein